jgi:hypothetical protein
VKSGAKIHRKLMEADQPAEAVRRLKNGSLRSLLIHLDKPHTHTGPPSDLILGTALVEAAQRWVKKGRAVL